MKDVSQKRHLAKTITWRLIGTIDSILLSWFITGSPYIGFKIGLAEELSKSFYITSMNDCGLN